MAALNCDKNDLLAVFPELKNLSVNQLWSLIALIFCKFQGGEPDAECDPAVLLEDAACLTCLSEKQMLEAVVALILNWGIDNGFMESDTGLRSDIACMLCLTPRQVKAIVLKLLCDGIASGNVLCARLV